MFSNCPYCGFLVALDEAGQPLSRCPNCAQRLRDDDASTDAATTPTAHDAGTTTSDPAGHVSEPTPSASAPSPVLEPPRGKADAAAADTRRQPSAAVDLQPIAVADETASARPDATTPAVVPDAAALARQDAAPGAMTPQANAGDDAGTMQAAGPATSVSKVRTPEGEEAATPLGASAAAADDTSPQPALRAARPEPPAVAAAADVVPAAADVQPAEPAQAGEPGGAAPPLPAPESGAEPPSATAPEPNAPSAATMTDDSTAGIADESPSARATDTSSTAAKKTSTPLLAADSLAAQPIEGAPPAPPDGDGPAVSGKGEGVAMSAATPAAAFPQSTDATAAAAPAVPPKPVRRKPGTTAVPSFARARAGAVAVDRRRLALRWSAIVALSLLLILQLVLSDRARLAGDARWRVVLTQLCGVLQCTLPAWHEPRAFRVIERDITLRRPGVLRVSARIRNDARWPQPWPALQLTLSDANGRDVATRVFTPSEYLGGAPTQSELGSGQSAALSMEIVEPGPQAVAFTFDFH